MTEPRLQNADQFPPEPIRRRRVPAGRAILVAFSTLVLTLFLDADGLMRTAEGQQQGLQRTVTVAVMRPIRATAAALGLTEPRAFVARVAGHDELDGFTSTDGVRVAGQDPTPSDPVGDRATTTTTTLPTFRTPSAQDPLRVLVAGDSLSGYLGPSLNRALTGYPATITEDQHVGSGLARPDVVDWPRELQSTMDARNPDVVALFMGGNDDQDLRTPDGWVSINDTAAWKAEYQRRIAQVMDIVARPGVTVYWVGMPAMGKAHLDRYVGTINALAKAEAAARPHSVTFVDAGLALNGPDGGFATFLPDAGGKQVTVRAPDGVHPTPSGMDRIVKLFVSDLIRDRHLNPPPPPTTTAPASKPASATTVGSR